MLYVEENCCIEHEGKHFCAGGAVVTPEAIIAYPRNDGMLCDWHGKVIGEYQITARWPIRSYWHTEMCQIEAKVDGVFYTGRGMGSGMLYRGKRKATQAWS